MILNEDYFDKYEKDDIDDASGVTGEAESSDVTPDKFDYRLVCELSAGPWDIRKQQMTIALDRIDRVLQMSMVDSYSIRLKAKDINDWRVSAVGDQVEKDETLEQLTNGELCIVIGLISHFNNYYQIVHFLDSIRIASKAGNRKNEDNISNYIKSIIVQRQDKKGQWAWEYGSALLVGDRYIDDAANFLRGKTGLTSDETYTLECIGLIMLTGFDAIQLMYNVHKSWQSYEREEMLSNFNRHYIKKQLSDYSGTKTTAVKMKLNPEVYSEIDTTGLGLFNRGVRIAYAYYPYAGEEDSVPCVSSYANSNNWPIKALVDNEEDIRVNDMRFLQTDNNSRIVMVADIGTWMIPGHIILPSGKEQTKIAHMFIVIDGIVHPDSSSRYRQEFKDKIQSVFPKFNDFTFDTMWSKLKSPQW